MFQQYLRFTQHNLSSIRKNSIYLFFWRFKKKGNSNVQYVTILFFIPNDRLCQKKKNRLIKKSVYFIGNSISLRERRKKMGLYLLKWRPLNAKCQTSGYYSLRATAISRQEKGLCHSHKPWPQTCHKAKVFQYLAMPFYWHMSNNSNLCSYNPTSWGSVLQQTMEFHTMIMLILEPSKMRTQLFCWALGVTRKIIKCWIVLVVLLILWLASVLIALLDLALFYLKQPRTQLNLTHYEYKTRHMQKVEVYIRKKSPWKEFSVRVQPLWKRVCTLFFISRCLSFEGILEKYFQFHSSMSSMTSLTVLNVIFLAILSFMLYILGNFSI